MRNAWVLTRLQLRQVLGGFLHCAGRAAEVQLRDRSRTRRPETRFVPMAVLNVQNDRMAHEQIDCGVELEVGSALEPC